MKSKDIARFWEKQSNHWQTLDTYSMKRSEKIYRNARHELLLALLMISGHCAAAAWAMVAFQSGNVPGGASLVVAATVALVLGICRGRECIRLCALAADEEQYEMRRGIRPRL
jgi:hypothetical protein